MKRAATVTLLCMGAGALFVANAYESRCRPVEEKKDTADWTDSGAPKPAAASSAPTSCRSDGGYYSHSYSSGHYYGGSGSSYGFSSSGVSRGGFGGSGHRSGG